MQNLEEKLQNSEICLALLQTLKKIYVTYQIRLHLQQSDYKINVSQTVQVKLSKMYSQIFAKNSASWYKNLNFAATELRSKIDFLTSSFFGKEGWRGETKVCGASWTVACARIQNGVRCGGQRAGNNPYSTPSQCFPAHILQRRPHNLNAWNRLRGPFDD